MDIGAHLTEVGSSADGAVTDARHTALGTSDLDEPHPARADRRRGRRDADRRCWTRTAPRHTLDALHRGALLAGGGALRPDITYRLTSRLHAPVAPVPAPHTAAVRGAAKLLQAAHTHPSTTGITDAAHLH